MISGHDSNADIGKLSPQEMHPVDLNPVTWDARIVLT
jgi:hypothetical protein